MDLNDYNRNINKLVVGGTILGDFVLAMLTYILFTWNVYGVVWDVMQLHTSILVGIIYLTIIFKTGVILYQPNVKRFLIVLKVFYNVGLFGLIAVTLLKLGQFRIIQIMQVILFLITLFVVESGFRLSVLALMKFYRSKRSRLNNVVFVGSKANILALYEEMKAVPSYGYVVNGYFDDIPNATFPEDCPYLGKLSDICQYLNNHKEVKELFCCLPSKRADEILKIIRFCDKHLVHFYSVPNVTNYLHHRVYFNMLGKVPYLSLYNDPLLKTENKLKKRLLDIAVSGLFLCTLFPIILLIITIITKITMPGPVFFRQKRNGLNGKEFYCYKFRSMKVNNDADKLQATKNDPRKTKWGDIMRKTNIDELPQFWNVLKGDMSLVGPRPHMLKHTEEYSQLINKYMVRHFVKPGITGWSQVTGFRGETKQLSQMEGRVLGDIWYIEHWSIGLDLYIMFRTVVNAICGDKAAY